MCQKQHGAASGPYANVASASVHILQGENAITRYASSRGVERCFCKVCGSNLTWQHLDHRERIGVTLGTFDTPYDGRSRTTCTSAANRAGCPNRRLS